jgi:hypothetical protein
MCAIFIVRDFIAPQAENQISLPKATQRALLAQVAAGIAPPAAGQSPAPAAGAGPTSRGGGGGGGGSSAAWADNEDSCSSSIIFADGASEAGDDAASAGRPLLGLAELNKRVDEDPSALARFIADNDHIAHYSTTISAFTGVPVLFPLARLSAPELVPGARIGGVFGLSGGGGGAANGGSGSSRLLLQQSDHEQAHVKSQMTRPLLFDDFCRIFDNVQKQVYELMVHSAFWRFKRSTLFDRFLEGINEELVAHRVRRGEATVTLPRNAAAAAAVASAAVSQSMPPPTERSVSRGSAGLAPQLMSPPSIVRTSSAVAHGNTHTLPRGMSAGTIQVEMVTM